MIWEDTRIGGISKWYLHKPKGADLRIPDFFLDCVVFLAVRDSEDEAMIFGGTGFFVGVDSRVPGRSYKVLVTAGHCVKQMEQYRYRYVRVNRADGTAAFIDISDDEWSFADDYPATDIAAIPMAVAPPEWKSRSIPLQAWAVPAKIEEEEIGLGDELFILGLFTKRSGLQRNIPIVRSGMIAAMPDEPISDSRSGLAYHAYLVETRSIGGLSGSPVFVDLHFGRSLFREPDTSEVRASKRTVLLLGLIRGHWPKEAYEVGDAATEDEHETFNTGIATVTPIAGLLPIINQEVWVNAREERDRAELAKNAPVEDFSGADEFEQFEDLTRKLVNTPKPKPESEPEESA